MGSCSSSQAVAPGSRQVTNPCETLCPAQGFGNLLDPFFHLFAFLSFRGAGLLLHGGPLKCGAGNESVGAVTDGRRALLA